MYVQLITRRRETHTENEIDPFLFFYNYTLVASKKQTMVMEPSPPSSEVEMKMRIDMKLVGACLSPTDSDVLLSLALCFFFQFQVWKCTWLRNVWRIKHLYSCMVNKWFGGVGPAELLLYLPSEAVDNDCSSSGPHCRWFHSEGWKWTPILLIMRGTRLLLDYLDPFSSYSVWIFETNLKKPSHKN